MVFLKSVNNVTLLLIYVSIMLLTIYFQQEYIVIPQMSNISIIDETLKSRIIENYFRFRWLMFLIPIIVMITRISLVAMCLYIGSLLNGNNISEKYKNYWGVALRADIVFVLFGVIACIAAIGMGFEAASNIGEFTSLAFLVDLNFTEQWLLVPIAALNIFEVCYWFFMAKMVAEQTEDGYWNSFKFVLSTYGVGYLFYIVFLMFLLLYLTN